MKKLATNLARLLGPELLAKHAALEELTIFVPAASIIRVLTILRDNSACLFKVLVDICGVDYPDRTPRFDVVYHLLSLDLNHRLRIKVQVADQAAVPSVCDVYPAANWYEREVWDLYGIPFQDHPDLRRLLTDYNFDGHPFRKDFPLTGYVETRYNDEVKRVVYEPVQLSQDYRSFDFLSPWEGILQTPKRPARSQEKAPDPDEEGAAT